MSFTRAESGQVETERFAIGYGLVLELTLSLRRWPQALIYFSCAKRIIYISLSLHPPEKNGSATETKLSTMYPAFSDRLVVTPMQPFVDCCQWHSCQASMSARRFQHLVLIFVLVAWGGVQ